MTKKPDARSRYRTIIRDIVVNLFRRRNLASICPGLVEPVIEDVKAVAETNRRIRELCGDMRRIETEVGHEFGMVALLGEDPPGVVRCVLSVMVASVTTAEVSCKDVASLGELCAGRDPSDLLLVHSAFARDGILRPHCTVKFRGPHIGDMRPALRQRAFLLLTGLPVSQADEFDEIERAARAIASA